MWTNLIGDLHTMMTPRDGGAAYRWSMTNRSWWRSPWSALVIAAAYLLLSLAVAWHIPAEHGAQPADALATIACVVAAVGLAVRDVSPRAMLALATVGVIIYAMRSYPGGPAYLAMPLAIFFYGLTRPRKESYAASAVAVAVAVGSLLVVTPWSDAVALLGLVAWGGVAILVSDVLRGRKERRETAEREQRERERRAQAQEQLWLARDLHDSVAHALTAIHVQSAIAGRQVRTDPDAAEQSLEAIRRTTGDALDELGTIVRSLRRQGEAPLAPTSSLVDVGGLVEQARRSGVEVVLDADTQVVPTRAAVAAAAYRVVQESLTNVVRHAPGARADVAIGRSADGGLVVRVVNDAPHPPVRRRRGTGLGLVGMRERVEGSGGTLDHGATPDGGYRVEARWEDM